MAHAFGRTYSGGSNNSTTVHRLEARPAAPRATSSGSVHHRRHSSFSPLDLLKLEPAPLQVKRVQPAAEYEPLFDPAYVPNMSTYASDEEAASSVERDDLSSASSTRNSSGRMSWDVAQTGPEAVEQQQQQEEDEDEDDDDLDDDDDFDLDDILDDDYVATCEVAEAIPIRLSVLGKQSNSCGHIEQQFHRAEVVRFFRPGRAKLICLSKTPGRPGLHARPVSPARSPARASPPASPRSTIARPMSVSFPLKQHQLDTPPTTPDFTGQDFADPAEEEEEEPQMPPARSGRRPSLAIPRDRSSTLIWSHSTSSPPIEEKPRTNSDTPSVPPTPPMTPARKQRLPKALGFFGSKKRNKDTAASRDSSTSKTSSPGSRSERTSSEMAPAPLQVITTTPTVKLVPRGAAERERVIELPASPQDDSDYESDMHPNFPTGRLRKRSRADVGVLRKLSAHREADAYNIAAAAAAANVVWMNN